MYTSYAKDIFCALVAADKDFKSTKEVMLEAINLVNIAKRAFLTLEPGVEHPKPRKI